MAVLSADTVADFIICFSHQHGDPITHLKLQKLLYYAQGLYLAEYGKPLFLEEIEAWRRGPVVRCVYARFPNQPWQPIAVEPVEPRLPKDVEALLQNMMTIYSGYTAYELERKTHEEGPWKESRGDLPPEVSSDAVIPLDSLREFFANPADKPADKPADEPDSEALADSREDDLSIHVEESIRRSK